MDTQVSLNHNANKKDVVGFNHLKVMSHGVSMVNPQINAEAIYLKLHPDQVLINNSIINSMKIS